MPLRNVPQPLARAIRLGSRILKGAAAAAGAIAFDTTGSTKLTSGALSATVDITAAATGAQVYCLVAVGSNETSFTFTGWTQILAGDESTATHYGLFRRQKIAGDTTFTVSWTATTQKATIGWASYTGLDPVTPDELAAVTLHTTGTTFASPSLTPSAAGEWALYAAYARDTTLATDLPDGSTWTADGALTERLDAANQAAATSPWQSIEFADSNAAVTVAAHSYTATAATAESHGAAFLLFLKPAAAAAAGPPVYPAGHPVQARIPPPALPAGRVRSSKGRRAIRLVNTFDGGTSGTTVTTGNSGGVSGDAFQFAGFTAGGTLAFSNTHAAHGTLSLAADATAGNLSELVAWQGAIVGLQDELFIRLYVYLTAYPASATGACWVRNGNTFLAGPIEITSSGHPYLTYSASNTVAFTFANAIPLNQWVRLEAHVANLSSTSQGTATLRYYSSPDSLTVTEEQTITGISFGGLTADQVLYGWPSGISGEALTYFDDIGVSNVTWLGPSQVQPRQLTAPVQARVPQPVRGGRAAGRVGATPVAAQAAAPVRALTSPVRAQAAPQRGGRTSSRTGVYGQAGPAVRPLGGPVRARVPQPSRGGSVNRRSGVYGGLGPAVKALASAVAAKLRGLPSRGRTTSRGGVYGNLGPPVKAATGPVQAHQLLRRGGSAQGRAGTYTSLAPTTGPPVYPLGHPVQARRLPLRGGHITRAAGVYGGTGAPVKAPTGPVKAQPAPARGGHVASRAGTLTAGGPQAGPPIYPAGHPVQARRLPARGGSTASRAGTFTAVATGSGPPVYPLAHPVQARRQPVPGGRVVRRAGTYAQTGPPVKPLAGPVGVYRRQPPPPTRGRVASQRGPYGQTGPPVVALRRPVRGQPQKPVLTGRAAWRTGVYTAPLVLPFTVGALSATDAPTAVLVASGTTSTLTAATAPTGTLTAGDKRTGGPG